ncbi:barstar family protein [Streptomyces prunicolor]|uniref:barstar family protein n=1 Tax=Streptomyces prunicolor TaxID=67348 RepID=UPI003713985F
MAIQSNPLTRPSSPWVIKADLDDASVRNYVQDAGDSGVVVEFQGGEARTLDSFFSMISSRLDFPEYFGRNWPALKDCLTDLEWLPADSYCLVFRNSDLLFADEPIERRAFLHTVKLSAEEWAAPVALGEWWDRPAIPFHVVLDLGIADWDADQVVEVGQLLAQ